MSIEAMTWVLNDAPIPSPTPAGVPSATTLSMVLLGLANHADRDGEDAFPSVATLARYARISERQVQRCLAAAVDLGLIVPGNQAIVAAKITRADQRPTCYNLAIHRRAQDIHNGATPCHPVAERGDTQTPNGVTGETERGDTHVTRTVLKPKDKPAMHAHPDEPTELASAIADCETAAAAAEKSIDKQDLDALIAALRGHDLTASFVKLDRDGRAEIVGLIRRCGIGALVKSARRQHRPDAPARFVQAWLPAWRELPDSRPAVESKTCDRCVNGWIENDEHDIIGRCTCRGAVA